MSQSRCTIKVEGLDCPVEANALREALTQDDGVERLDFDLIHGTMTVHHNPDVSGPTDLVMRVTTRTGMKASLITADKPAKPDPWIPLPWLLTMGSGIALGLGMFVGSIYSFPLFLVAIILGGIELVPRAVRAAIRWNIDIHVLMSLAILGAIALGQWDEAATVAFLFGLSEALEALSVARAGESIRALLEIEPQNAELIGPDGAVSVVEPTILQVGDRVRVRAGERVPVDGTVVAGRSFVDQKAITGESEPVLREPGDGVYAGTVSGDGALEIVTTARLGDALISRIIERVKAAQSNRTPIEQSISKFARIYTPIVVVIALLVILGPPLVQLVMGATPGWATWLNRGLVILVVACPCALVIATPVAVASALASAARRGVLVKGGSFLEEFGRLRVLAFDKTGTLTTGTPDVVEVVAWQGSRDDEILSIAAALGEQGGHVLGRAISRHARALKIDVPVAEAYAAVPGLGASGRVNSIEYHMGSHRYLDESGLCSPEFHATIDGAEAALGTSVAIGSHTGPPMGWIRLADHPRAEAASVLADLRALGVESVMLTGDNATAADAIGNAIGLTDRRAGLLPGDKASLIASWNLERGPTGMVGDGVNDAPALAAARVSVAMGGISSPAAIETADVVLMADDLKQIPWLVRHSRSTLRTIQQNITFALVTKAIVMILAIFNLATLWMAILADVGTTLIVTANALKLLRSGRVTTTSDRS
jgi:Cd2+/Zn2+-exporting ATPase